MTSFKKPPLSTGHRSDSGRSSLPIAGVSLSAVIVIVTMLSVPLAAGQSMGLSSSLTATWIAGIYGIPSLIGIGLALRYRQPLAATGTILAIILVATVGDQFTFSELSGAFMLAGIAVVILSITGVTQKLARWIPPPIVFGILAGAVLSFVVAIFEPLRENTVTGVALLVAFLAGAAAVIAELLPFTLLMALAGLAMLGVFIDALKETVKNTIVLGPIFAFVISVSNISLFGFGAYFWALVIGTGVSLLLEGDRLREIKENH